MMGSDKTWKLAAVIGALTAIAPVQAAESWPSHPVRLITGSPGSTSDITARFIGQRLAERWAQQVVVDNRPGAGGNIGAEIAARSAPDGYTLFNGQIGTHASPQFLFKKLSYDPLKDFAPVTAAVSLGYVLVGRPDHPAKSLPELIALAKAKPGAMNFASNGAGSGPHIVMEMLNHAAGIQLVHIPMNTPGATAVLTGEVEFVMNPVTTAVPLVASGKLRGLAVSTPDRIPALPNVPAVAETLPGYAADAWHGFFAPAGTPAAIVEKLAADLGRALREPSVHKRLAELGLDVIAATPQVFAAQVKADYDKWGEVVRIAKIRLD